MIFYYFIYLLLFSLCVILEDLDSNHRRRSPAFGGIFRGSLSLGSGSPTAAAVSDTDASAAAGGHKLAWALY